MEQIRLTINGIPLSAKKDQTILTVCQENNINIPSLCHIDCLKTRGNCRICVVEVKGEDRLVPACSFRALNGMEILTHSERVKRARKTILELLLANHPEDCLVCLKNGECEIQDLAKEFGVRERRYVGFKRNYAPDLSSRAIERDPNKCVLCGRCIEVCNSVQEVGALNYLNSGFDTVIAPASFELAASECVFCGQCVLTCPTGALRERSALKNVWTAISDPGKKVAAVISPSAKIGLFEETDPKSLDGLMVSALKTLGFDYVFDMSIANRLYLETLSTELEDRVKENRLLPLIPAFCPAVVNLIEKRYPELIPYLSQIKSPGQLAGALIKTTLADNYGISPRDLFVVEIKPCTAAKDEANREGLRHEGYNDIDAVLTTRELERMFMTSGIKAENLEMENFDLPFQNNYPSLNLLEVAGGFKAIFEQSDLGVAIESFDSLAKANKTFQNFDKFSSYSLLEIFACKEGCIGGGGSNLRNLSEIKERKDRFLANNIQDTLKPDKREQPKNEARYKTLLLKDMKAVYKPKPVSQTK
ncbi:MAG: [Fe-Fe] hydrogenase large subunit C-terminal domain-containing protein [Firmicutes bacterium]|nr:[Fe-Fe] hydrogenase large subunit C-terminal domain-containing protein [Bacillota bacterium]MDD4263919.1 [Fe-Fe] hydrogenase large subunit C-terminal domain-containing protein [Bacillota bacterium]MDD4693689.1 [Fe-Fe] hydrogenase large subunit C-terminal domain-containing protein [Bacillota bacterium]